MALSRTWYDTLIDDDGSNTVGSIIDKADIDALMDAIDAELAAIATAYAPLAGSWTPIIIGSIGYSGQVYTTQVGRYVKVGKLVHVQGRISLSTRGTLTGAVQLAGFPFAFENVTSCHAPLQFGYWGGLATAVIGLRGFGVAGSAAATVYMNTAAATGLSGAIDTDFGNASDLIFDMTYRTD